MTIVLDTSFLVDLQREDHRAHQTWTRLIAEGQSFLIPSPAIVELLAGSKDPRQDSERLRQAAEIAELGEAEAIASAGLARRALKEGRFPGWADLYIAGIALHRGDLPILTANADHFPFSKTLTYR